MCTRLPQTAELGGFLATSCKVLICAADVFVMRAKVQLPRQHCQLCLLCRQKIQESNVYLLSIKVLSVLLCEINGACAHWCLV